MVHVLNLDAQFSPISGTSVGFQLFRFNGGEIHLKIDSNLDARYPVVITHRLNSFEKLGELLLAVDALKRMQVQISQLIIPYFPAARQDRVMTIGEPLSVKVYADLINNLKLPRVTIFDPHSDVTPALIDNCNVVDNQGFIAAVKEFLPKNICLIAPDGGALKKVYKLAGAFGNVPVVECSKRRNVQTGELSEFKVHENDLKGADCLLVDDICDGGGTFMGLARELRKKNCGKLYLAVSHGIFSHGLDHLFRDFEKIFTTDSIQNISHQAVQQIALHSLLQ